MRSLSTPPVILESNYTLELQSSFETEIMPGKNYNRPGIIIHPSVGFLIAKLCFSLLLKKLPDNPWFFFTMRVALGSTASKLTLRTENSGEKNHWNTEKSLDFPTIQLTRTGNWILHNGCYLVQNFGAKIQFFSRFSAAFAKHEFPGFLPCPDCQDNTNNYKLNFATCCLILVRW